MDYRHLLLFVFTPLPIASYAAGECSTFKSFIASQIGEGTRTYKTSKFHDTNWPENKCQIRVTTKLEDTVTLGKFNQNGLLACQAIYTATDADTGLSYNIKSTPFAITVSDSGKPLDALYAEASMKQNAGGGVYRAPPLSVKLSNEGAPHVGAAKSCSVEQTPVD